MTTPQKPAERDRDATERRLLESIGEMVREQGFEKIGINAVAARSGVSKILIYRYFGSVEGLMIAYIRQHDFWINFPVAIPRSNELPDFLKSMFRGQIERLRNDPTLRRLSRWELSTNNEMIDRLREQREAAGTAIVAEVSRATGRAVEEIAPIATLLSAGLTYLAMLEDHCPTYNDIPLRENRGWEQLARGIDVLIDKWFLSERPRSL